VRLVVLVTDGFIGNERDVFAAVERELGDARVFTFGVGTAVNRYLLEQIAEIGRGDSDVVGLAEDPVAAADRFVARIDRPYLTDVSIDWGGLDVGDVYPRVIPDLYADRPIVVLGRYRRAGRADVRVHARLRGAEWSRAVHVVLPERASDHEALPSMWARARIHDLDRAMFLGEVPALRDEETQLGLAFGLVTDATSFVAVDQAPAADTSTRPSLVPPMYVAQTVSVSRGAVAGSPGSVELALAPAPYPRLGGCASCGARRGVARAGRTVIAAMVVLLVAGRRRRRGR
jgi:Ca-activated chloride channel family protein